MLTQVTVKYVYSVWCSSGQVLEFDTVQARLTQMHIFDCSFESKSLVSKLSKTLIAAVIGKEIWQFC